MLDPRLDHPRLMAVSFLVILFFGKRFSERVTSGIGIFVIGVCFVLVVRRRRCNWIQRINHPVPDTSAAEALITQPDGAPGAHRRPDRRRGRSSEPTAVRPRPRPTAEERRDHRVEGSRRPRPPPRPTASTGRGRRGRGRARRRGRARGRSPIVTRWTWFQCGDINFEVGTIVDGLSVMMLVHRHDHLAARAHLLHGVPARRRPLHPLLRLPEPVHGARCSSTSSASNTLQMLVGWELVGVCSFVLIGHWWEEKNNTDAALKAFLTNRVGDVGLHHRRDHHVLRRRRHQLQRAAHQRVRPGARRPTRPCCWSARCACSAASRRSRASSRCTPGCPTPWPARRRCRRSSTPPPWSSPASTSSPGSTRCSSRASTSAPTRINYVAVIGGVTIVGRGAAGLRPDRHQEGAGLLDHQPARLHGHGPRRRAPGPAASSTSSPTPSSRPACSSAPARSATPPTTPSTCARWVGSRKYMPTTFWTFLIGTLALVGIFPLAGFWSKDEILAGVAATARQPRLHVHADHRASSARS